MLYKLLLAVIIAIAILLTTCSFDEEIDEATKRCEQTCNRVFNDKIELINAIVEEQSQFCITPEYLSKVLRDIYLENER